MKTKELVYINVRRIKPSNDKIDREVVEAIKSNPDPYKFKALPAYWSDGIKKFIITDGNHRLTALKELGFDYAPCVLLDRKEFDFIKFSKRTLGFMVRVPEKIEFWG